MNEVFGVSTISKQLGLTYTTTQLLLFLGHIEGIKVARGRQHIWSVKQSEIERIQHLRANPPIYDESTLGKEFVERYGYKYPDYRFDEFDEYATPADDPTAEPVLVSGSNVELLEGEATPHTLTQEGVASVEDWCDFLNEKRYAVMNAGPLILPHGEIDQWARRVRSMFPKKKFTKKVRVWKNTGLRKKRRSARI